MAEEAYKRVRTARSGDKEAIAKVALLQKCKACLDAGNPIRSLQLDDYYKMRFDFAVEDSPLAFRFFSHLPDLRVMVFDRPWNREAAFPNGNYRRCFSWESIRKAVEA